MNIYDEVHAFAKEFINFTTFRTAGRKAKIREAYKKLTGKNISASCSTCYIEALFVIINNTPMASKNYRMKKGYVAQFDIAYKGIKAFTNAELTDNIAAEYLKRHPERIVYFEKVPVPIVEKAVKEAKKKDTDLEIVEPKKEEPKDEVSNDLAETYNTGADDVLKEMGAEKPEKKTVKKPRSTSKAKKTVKKDE